MLQKTPVNIPRAAACLSAIAGSLPAAPGQKPRDLELETFLGHTVKCGRVICLDRENVWLKVQSPDVQFDQDIRVPAAGLRGNLAAVEIGSPAQVVWSLARLSQQPKLAELPDVAAAYCQTFVGTVLHIGRADALIRFWNLEISNIDYRERRLQLPRIKLRELQPGAQVIERNFCLIINPSA